MKTITQADLEHLAAIWPQTEMLIARAQNILDINYKTSNVYFDEYSVYGIEDIQSGSVSFECTNRSRDNLDCVLTITFEKLLEPSDENIMEQAFRLVEEWERQKLEEAAYRKKKQEEETRAEELAQLAKLKAKYES